MKVLETAPKSHLLQVGPVLELILNQCWCLSEERRHLRLIPISLSFQDEEAGREENGRIDPVGRSDSCADHAPVRSLE